jgi:hypothetical protein
MKNMWLYIIYTFLNYSTSSLEEVEGNIQRVFKAQDYKIKIIDDKECILTVFGRDKKFSSDAYALFLLLLISEFFLVEENYNQKDLENFLKVLFVAQNVVDKMQKECCLERRMEYLASNKVEFNLQKIKEYYQMLLANDDLKDIIEFFSEEKLLNILINLIEIHKGEKLYDSYFVRSIKLDAAYMVGRRIIDEPVYYFQYIREVFFPLEITIKLMRTKHKYMQNFFSLLTKFEKTTLALNARELVELHIPNTFELKKEDIHLSIINNTYVVNVLGEVFNFLTKYEADFFIETVGSIIYIRSKKEFIEFLKIIIAIANFITYMFQHHSILDEIKYIPVQEAKEIINQIEIQRYKSPLLEYLNFIDFYKLYCEFMKEKINSSYKSRIYLSDIKCENYKITITKLTPEEFYKKKIILLLIKNALFFLKTYQDKRVLLSEFDILIENFYEENTTKSSIFQ